MSNRPCFLRILALVLLVSMLLGMLPVTAAEPGEDLQTIARGCLKTKILGVASGK